MTPRAAERAQWPPVRASHPGRMRTGERSEADDTHGNFERPSGARR
jgi:hypothetical protein